MSNGDGTGNGKLSFAFGSSSAKGPSPGAAPNNGASTSAKPLSNMEALMAKAKAKNGTAASSSGGVKSNSSGKGNAPVKSIFGDEDEDDSGPSSLASARAGGSRSGRPDILSAPHLPAPSSSVPRTAAQLSRGANRAISSALSLDANAFAYDEVYDSLKASEAAREAQRKAEAAQRAPKYIDSFLASAETRRLDRLRAEEKMLALEREKEGGEFDDKEKFVTEGYKKQMEEVRKAEEEEKKREEAMRKSGKGPGLSAFYKTMLDTQTAAHDSVVASASAHGNIGPSLAIRPPTEPAQPMYEPEDEYDPTLDRGPGGASGSGGSSSRSRLPRLNDDENAAGAASSGAPDTSAGSSRAGLRASGSRPAARPRLGPLLHDDTDAATNGAYGADDSDDDDDTKVQINDDGEVVNKRTLLRAGLNITKKPGSFADVLAAGAGSSGAGGADQPYVSRAVGTAASYRDRMERERKRLAENMRIEAERKKREEEERYREEEEAARRRREGDDGQAEQRRKEAKERFLERKRQREEGKKDKDKDGEAKKAKV